LTERPNVHFIVKDLAVNPLRRGKSDWKGDMSMHTLLLLSLFLSLPGEPNSPRTPVKFEESARFQIPEARQAKKKEIIFQPLEKPHK